MQFQITVTRAVIGHDIDVQVTAEGTERISQVRTELDNFSIGADSVSEGTTSYQRSWPREGDAGPGQEHTLRVTVQDNSGGEKSATKLWKDIT